MYNYFIHTKYKLCVNGRTQRVPDLMQWILKQCRTILLLRSLGISTDYPFATIQLRRSTPFNVHPLSHHQDPNNFINLICQKIQSKTLTRDSPQVCVTFIPHPRVSLNGFYLPILPHPCIRSLQSWQEPVFPADSHRRTDPLTLQQPEITAFKCSLLCDEGLRSRPVTPTSPGLGVVS